MILNEFQEEAANHVDGPCLVTACPGSGKTATLVERTIRLLKRGINPKNILCITFTNKAAKEMKERISKAMDNQSLGLYAGTFHALCVKILRKLGKYNGYSSNFIILDAQDQKDLISQIAKNEGIELEKKHIGYIAKSVNDYRDKLAPYSFLEEQLYGDQLEVAVKYLKSLKKNNIIDFSGLIYETIKLLENNENVKEAIQENFKYLQVDEVQDTNYSQFYLLNLFSEKWKNITMCGDLNQCIPEGQKVLTPEGYKNIEDLNAGDRVKTGKGGEQTIEKSILNKYQKYVENHDVVSIRTKTGKIAKFSKEHIVFAGFAKKSPKKIVVYLMYDKNLGYRVGVTNTFKKYSFDGIGGAGRRLSQERATCMWVLKVVDDIAEAKYWEQYYSVKYGIPTWCFHAKYRGLDYNHEMIKKIFSNIDSFSNASKLMTDLLIDKNYPHYQPKCMSKKRRRNFIINFCGDSRRGKTRHRYSISGSDESDSKKLLSIGLAVRGNGKGRGGWRVESSCKDIRKVYDILESVSEVFNNEINVIEKIRLNNDILKFMPASHLREGMMVYIEDGGMVLTDEIVSIEYEKYDGYLYDIDVEEYHNFVTNGIFCHNSIYKFRGARYQNILDFVDKHPDCKVINLSYNYRSTPEIVKHAYSLIKHNENNMIKSFETQNPSGDSVKCMDYEDQYHEAYSIAQKIQNLIKNENWEYNDFAILYRMNSMSEPLEQAFVKYGIPYEVIGSRSFYDRKEIRDCMAMLKFLVNRMDKISFYRLSSLIKGMGGATVKKIEKVSEENDIDILEAARKLKYNTNSKRVKDSCIFLCDIYDEIDVDSGNPALCLSQLTEKFKYNKYLDKNFNKEQYETKKENVEQLIISAGNISASVEGIDGYLQNIALMSSSDKETKEGKVSLMTLHASKGLEFPIVFLIGVETGILPHNMSMIEDEEEGICEERRLAYVGMSRAESKLFLSYCSYRKKWKNRQFAPFKSYPSQFLYETGLIEDNNERNP